MAADDPLGPFLRMSLGPFLPELCTSFPPSCYRYTGLAKLWQGLYCFIYTKIQSSSQAAGRILLPRNLSTAFLPCLSLVQQGSAMCNGFWRKLRSASQDHYNIFITYITSCFYFIFPKSIIYLFKSLQFHIQGGQHPMYKMSLKFCESQQLNRTRCWSWPVQLAECLHFTGVVLLEVLNNSLFICTQPSQFHFHYKRIKIEITSAPQQAYMAVFPQEIGAPFEMQCGRNIWNLRL